MKLPEPKKNCLHLASVLRAAHTFHMASFAFHIYWSRRYDASDNTERNNNKKTEINTHIKANALASIFFCWYPQRNVLHGQSEWIDFPKSNSIWMHVIESVNDRIIGNSCLINYVGNGCGAHIVMRKNFRVARRCRGLFGNVIRLCQWYGILLGLFQEPKQNMHRFTCLCFQHKMWCEIAEIGRRWVVCEK